jgi:acetylornithine/succinyldiaminopimelate/putrescine aminotransferase
MTYNATQADFLASVYGGLFSVFLSSVYHAMESLPNLKNSEIEPFMLVLETVRGSGLLERFDVDVHARFAEVTEQVQRVSRSFYQAKIQQLQSAPGVNRALPLLFMTDELEKAAKLLSKRFPDPLFGCVSFISSLMLS